MKALLILLALALSLGACSPVGQTDESHDPILPAIY